MTFSYPTLEQETDSDLLCLIGMAADDPQAADDAFREFHKRHASYFFRRIFAWINELGDQRRRALDPETIVSQALMKAYYQASGYQDQSGGDRSRGTAQVRAWLFKIAQRLIYDQLETPSAKTILSFAEELPPDAPLEDSNSSLTEAEKDKICQALDELPESDRDIITTCLSYGAFGDNADKLPSEIRQQLMEAYGLTNITFRQRKSRALKKLQSSLQ